MRKYEEWEGIYSSLHHIDSGCDEDLHYRTIIAKTLQKLPQDVREKVVDEVLFLHTTTYGTVNKLRFPVPPKTKVLQWIEQPIIMLNFAIMERDGKSIPEMMDNTSPKATKKNTILNLKKKGLKPKEIELETGFGYAYIKNVCSKFGQQLQ